jgi:hypothetical protein
MAEDLIRYDILAQDALRGVVRKVLSEVARTGLPGAHHFFIKFATRAPGVRVSSRLLKEYPEEMTIVLQHQFRDLTVNEQMFEVGLSFSGVSEHLVVPFDAIKRFFDPSVQFGLQFETMEATGEAAAKEGAASADAERTPAKPAPVGKPTTSVPSAGQASAAKPAEGGPEGEAPSKGDGGAEVVRLDRFRKK